MNAPHLAQLALEVWRASGARTPERLAALVDLYAEGYFGPAEFWSEAIRAEVASARERAAAGVRPWELAR